MAAPSWRHIGTNYGYWRSVTAVMVKAMIEAVVDGCVTDVRVEEGVDKMEEVEEVADGV